MATVVNKQI